MTKSPYSRDIVKSVDKLCLELERFHPGITNKEYESGGDKSTFHERMQMGLYIELIKAGVIK